MTKRIFRSIMLVSALVLVIGLGFIMGILYPVSYTHLTLPTILLV